MEKLYIKIIEKIEASAQVFIDKGLPAVKYIDFYRGQPTSPERFEFYDLPAVFIQYRTNKNYISLDIHVLTDPNHDTNNKSPFIMSGLDIIRYYETIKDLLVNLESDNASKLHWVADEPLDADVINYHIITFECYYETIVYSNYPEQSDPDNTELDMTGNLKTRFIVD